SETAELRGMLRDAESYLRSFDWCPSFVERDLGYGLGEVIALFLFKLGEKIHGVDDQLWVVVGDLPSAYFVCDDAETPAAALEVYCGLMEDWAQAVLNGSSLDDVFPVSAEPTPEHASMLLSRTKFIRERLIPIASER
ncbi:MAG: hypothetical protein KJ060_20260, partial [Candidatus Hydrogenedentes bacterium]|nr:hypothetical protein [Candidatus Hydrogenedentota bacterium]